MTNAQRLAIERIRKMVERSLYGDRYEIKKFEIRETEYFISVFTETGLKGDEGTYAGIICRDRAHFFVGPKGGITYPVTSKRTGKQIRKTFGKFDGFLTVVVAQA